MTPVGRYAAAASRKPNIGNLGVGSVRRYCQGRVGPVAIADASGPTVCGTQRRRDMTRRRSDRPHPRRQVLPIFLIVSITMIPDMLS